MGLRSGNRKFNKQISKQQQKPLYILNNRRNNLGLHFLKQIFKQTFKHKRKVFFCSLRKEN